MQVAPAKRVKIDPRAKSTPIKRSSKAIQVGRHYNTFEMFTSHFDINPITHGDSGIGNRISSISIQGRSNDSDVALPAKKAAQKRRTLRGLNAGHPSKSMIATMQMHDRDLKYPPPEPLDNESNRSLTSEPSQNPSNQWDSVEVLLPTVTRTASSQTTESWPLLEKRLNIFEKSKRKIMSVRSRSNLKSTHVQAVKPPAECKSVKTLASPERGDKWTQIRLAKGGTENVESFVNTERQESSCAIQCDISVRKKPIVKKSQMTATDHIRGYSSVTDVSIGRDVRANRSEHVCDGKHRSGVSEAFYLRITKAVFLYTG